MNLKEELKAFVDGELTADQVKEIERAAASSEEIRDEIVALRSLKEEFAALAATPEPAGKIALLRRLKVAKPVRKPNRIWAYAGVTAALLIGVAIAEPVLKGSADEAAVESSSKEMVASQAPAAAEMAAPEGMDLQRSRGNEKSKEEAADFGHSQAGSEVAGQARRLSEETAPAPAREPRDQKAAGKPVNAIPPSYGRDIIYNGAINLEVADVQKSVTEASSLIQGLGGFVVSSESSLDGEGKASAYLEVRIPAAKFDTANKSLAKYGRILSQNSSGQDVTADIARGEGRSRALAVAEQEYIRMLNATRNTTARLEVRRRLDEVRAEREAIKAELTRMKDLAALSSLSIRFEEKEVVKPDVPGENWWDDSNTGAANVLGFVGRILGRVAIYLAYLSPVWIAGLAVWWFARRRASG